MTSFAIVAGALAAVAAGFSAVRHLLSRPHRIGDALVHKPTDDTRTDERGAVRSIQGADIEFPEDALGELWTPATLERLARTYWAFLSRCTFGLIRVAYTDAERFVVFVRRPFVLLRFQAPEYEMNADRGIVRWRIDRGILVARRGRGGDGYLEIDVQRCPSQTPGTARIHVEVEVANFYPAIASAFTRFVYSNTQSRIHVLVTYGFLRRLVRRDLETSVAGRFAAPATPQATPEPERDADRRARSLSS